MRKFLISLFFAIFLVVPSFALDENSQIDGESNTFDTKEVVASKSFRIGVVDPKKTDNRSSDIVIYTKLFGHFTDSDMKGYEAVIVDNKVVKMNQGNSYIPQNGYVVSGHGKAKKFILENLFEGADVEIDFNKSELKVITHPDSYLYEAKYRLDKVKSIYDKADKTNLDNEKIEFYIERAENLLNTTSKLIVFGDYENAPQMAQDSVVYSDMALYLMELYDENEFKGIKVFPYQKNENEVQQAFNAINSLGIDNIFLDVYYNGQTVYKSDVQEQYKLIPQNRYYGDFDVLNAWLSLAKEHEKNVYVTFNVFNIGVIPKSEIKTSLISVYPKWEYKTDDRQTYLNPEDEQVQRYIMALIDEIIQKYEIAGVNITGLNVPMKNPTAPIKEFMNKVSAYQHANEKVVFFVDIYPFSTDIKNWNFNENLTLCPVLTSSDVDFTKTFLTETDKYAMGANVIPVYTQPYLEEKPRTFFEQLSVAREIGLKGIIIDNLDYLTKEYVNAFKLSVFNAPNDKKQDNSSLVQMNYNEESQTDTKENNEAEK